MKYNILEKIKSDPYLGVATFGSMGWTMDNFAHEYIYKRLKEFGYDSEDYERWEATIICSALMAALCHEASQNDPYDMDAELAVDTNEILIHGMIHPENLATIINVEQGWKMVTTQDRMNDIIAGYMFSNKSIKGITRRHINDLEIDRDHTHIVVIQDVSLDKPLIGEFNIDSFNIGVLSGYDPDDDDEDDDDVDDLYDVDDVYDDDSDEEDDEYEQEGWIDYRYDQIDDIIETAMHKPKEETDLLDGFWHLIENKSKQTKQSIDQNVYPEDSLSKLSSKEVGNIPPKSKIKSNKANSESSDNKKDISSDPDNPFYKFITAEMKFPDN
jgi:hypothetical protein